MRTESPLQRLDDRHRKHGGGVDALIACAVLAIVAAIVAGLSWTRPTVAPASVSYTQSGRLAYSAATRPGSVYDAGQVTTGEPVYGSAVSTVTVSYTYRLQAAASTGVTGTEQLVATMSNGDGLSRTLPLQPGRTSFTGPGFTATGTLQLSALRSLATAFETAASGYGSGSYPVTISPSVSLHGRLGGQPLSTSFSSPVDFTYSSGNLLPGSASGSGGPPTFTSSASGSVSIPGGRPATLLLGISVASARIASLAVLLVTLLLGGLAGWPLLRQATSDNERDRITARYGSLIVEADGVAPHAGVTVVQLASFDDVVRVARRLECPILHWGEVGDIYAVVDSGTLYRYRAGTSWAAELAGRVASNGSAPQERAVAVGRRTSGTSKWE